MRSYRSRPLQQFGLRQMGRGGGKPRRLHDALLPNTEKVLYWGYGDARDDLSRIWDYSTPAGTFSSPGNQPFNVTSPPQNRGLANIWSAEHAFLNDAEGT